MADQKFKGCPYPIVNNPLGLLAVQSGVNQIKSDLLILLLTNPGERVMLPNFGTPLNKLFFEPNDAIIVNQAMQVIADAIATWEPRVAITNISVSVGTESLSTGDFMQSNPPTDSGLVGGDYSDSTNDNGSALSIVINFVDPEDIQSIQELTLEVPIG